MSHPLFACLSARLGLFVLLALPLSLSLPAHAAKKAPPPPPAGPLVELGESFPVETSLDDPAVRDAQVIWLEMIGRAKVSVDVAEFYITATPGSRMEPVVKALQAAGQRGVKVRVLADAKFAKTYPEQLDLLGKSTGVELRRYDMNPLTGGVLHAKYFVVDGAEGWVGSQNMDWRSLTHIGELGLRFTEPGAVSSLSRVFELDWRIAGGEAPPALTPVDDGAAADPLPMAAATFNGQPVTVALAASPGELLPASVPWDLPPLLAIIDSAKTSVKLEFLTYSTSGYDKVYWDALDRSLRRAANRGVKVELLVADWSKKYPEALQSLEVMKNIDVKFMVIPVWSGGFVDFSRVMHSKYLVADGARAWLGTSNASRDYFHGSRNVSLFVDGAPFAQALEQHFALSWGSPYAEAVNPTAAYTAPKTK